MSASIQGTIQAEHDGERLDAALARLLPGHGLRARRRLCAQGAVLVNNRTRPKGFRVSLGDTVTVHVPSPKRTPEERSLLDAVRLLRDSGPYAALYKPPGLHSESLADRGGPAAEEALPTLLPSWSALLLNRLDRPTSGILLAARDAQAKEAFERHQEAGRICKEYLAVVHGDPGGDLEIAGKIEASGGRKVRVLHKADQEPWRWTWVKPLQPTPDGRGTITAVRILKGRRHQIRAHLASVGHPIFGDSLYGQGQGPLLLHHWRAAFPGFEATVRPGWLTALVSGDLEALLQGGSKWPGFPRTGSDRCFNPEEERPCPSQ